MTEVTIQTESKTYKEDIPTNLSSWAQNVIVNGYRRVERTASNKVVFTFIPPTRIISVSYEQ